MWEYSDKVKEHFLNPRNVGVVENADGIGEVGSMSCGDALKLTFKLDENEIITDVKFQTFGCASAIASSSALTEMMIGKTLSEAEKITNDDIVAFLGGLPKEKMHCSVMGQEALEKAIACYRGVPVEEKEGEIVCECFGVTDLEIQRALKEHNLSAVEDVTNYIKAGGGCGKCHERIQELINEFKGHEPVIDKKPEKLSNIKKIKLIEETLEREIKPALKKDGGDIELVDVDGSKIFVKLQGACSSCSAAQITLKEFVEKKLCEFVSPDLVVEEVS
ncbi:Nitrogen fixation protein [Desulfonema limicola]|uniref:Nitrogen fixation protein NifU n=1 Tax=Desulfonema limicola TaxID=45656 RepID=A0A975B6C5_9BACT|nr:Fe-S cluster assembly protein NifU [Desulfonema limicola]QTA79597.1 Nitrogen fixation protein [Desulfonema limicola]